MYHDQGLVPFKMLAFDTGVNVTLGLPIVRTSPDHGTAFDIAWKGIAKPTSMIEAIKVVDYVALVTEPTALVVNVHVSEAAFAFVTFMSTTLPFPVFVLPAVTDPAVVFN